MKSYEEGKAIYYQIKGRVRRQFATPVPRESINIYLQGFKDGFNRGLKAKKCN